MTFVTGNRLLRCRIMPLGSLLGLYGNVRGRDKSADATQDSGRDVDFDFDVGRYHASRDDLRVWF